VLTFGFRGCLIEGDVYFKRKLQTILSDVSLEAFILVCGMI